MLLWVYIRNWFYENRISVPYTQQKILFLFQEKKNLFQELFS
jgi:hypothetical protein